MSFVFVPALLCPKLIRSFVMGKNYISLLTTCRQNSEWKQRLCWETVESTLETSLLKPVVVFLFRIHWNVWERIKNALKEQFAFILVISAFPLCVFPFSFWQILKQNTNRTHPKVRKTTYLLCGFTETWSYRKFHHSFSEHSCVIGEGILATSLTSWA